MSNSAEFEDHSPSKNNKENLLQHGIEINNRYKIDHLIGRGGYGEVYKGMDQTLGREVAIKVLYKQHDGDQEKQRREEQRFINEARITAQLIHSSLPITHDFGSLNSVNGEFFIVCEFLKGRALSDLIDLGCLSVGEALEFIVQSAGALAVAHARGVLHRDLKPSNIFCVIDGSVVTGPQFKVLDFGIAKVTQDNELAGLNSDETREGLIVGTPKYMAPERLQGQDYGTPSDIYGLGVIFYKMLTQALPFKGDNLVNVLINQMNEAPPELKLKNCSTELQKHLQDLFEAMTHFKPSLRIQSAVELKKRASQIQIQFAEEIAKFKPTISQYKVETSPQESALQSKPPQKQDASEGLYQNEIASPFNSSYDGLFDDGFGGNDEQTSASRIAKNRVLSNSQENQKAPSGPQASPLKPLNQLRSPSTPTPSAIQKIKLNIQPTSSGQESQEIKLNSHVSSLDQRSQEIKPSPITKPDQPLAIPMEAFPNPIEEKEESSKLKFIVLALVVASGLGLFLLSSGPETSTKELESPASAAKTFEDSKTIDAQEKTGSSDTLELDIDEPIELAENTTKTSKKTVVNPGVPKERQAQQIKSKESNKRKESIKKKKARTASKERSKNRSKPKAHTQKSRNATPEVVLPKRVTLSLSPMKPTYLVGNKLRLIVKADGKKSTDARIRFSPKGKAKLQGNTLLLKKEGSISLSACIGTVCAKKKVIVYNDLFSDFE